MAVFRQLIAQMDTDADGTISEKEQRAYAERVLRDLSLSADGRYLTPQLLSIRFPPMDEMEKGSGEIQLDFSATLPPGGRNRRITFENHHQRGISAYQVNCLVPRDPGMRVTTQSRNYTQSFYQLEYEQTDVRLDPQSSAAWPTEVGWLGAAILLLLSRAILRRRQRPSATATATHARYT